MSCRLFSCIAWLSSPSSSTATASLWNGGFRSEMLYVLHLLPTSLTRLDRACPGSITSAINHLAVRKYALEVTLIEAAHANRVFSFRFFAAAGAVCSCHFLW